MREHATVAQAVDGVGTPFDLRHNPGDEKGHEERDELGDETGKQAYISLGVGLFRGRRMELVADTVRAVNNGSEEGDEDEQAPAGAKAVFADEDPVESRRLLGWDRFGDRQGCIVMESLVVGLSVVRGVQGCPR